MTLDSNQQYNKQLKGLARELRNESTKSEIYLWIHVLRAKQMKGYSFGRQRAIGDYIVDFVCRKLHLVIEVDGYSHSFNEIQERDEAKEQFLQNSGYIVLRFLDEEVVKDTQNVIRVIESTIEDLEKHTEFSPPP